MILVALEVALVLGPDHNRGVVEEIALLLPPREEVEPKRLRSTRRPTPGHRRQAATFGDAYA